MSKYVKLPGQPSKPATMRARDVEDRRPAVDRENLQRQILHALAAGPVAAWDLRTSLRVGEKALSRALHQLRTIGQVKTIALQQLRRKWALSTWEAPAPRLPDAQTAVLSKKPAPAADSWWTRGLTREEFQDRVRRGPQ